MKVVIYARFSSHNQNEQSIEGQLKVCYEYAERNNHTIVYEYIDRATTGTNDNRPQFQKMIEDSSKKHFEGVLVYQLDRFARNRYDSATYKAKLKKNGVRVISARENIAEDASGILVEGVLESMAEYYSAELSQKVKRGMDINASKCLCTGGNIALGYYADIEKRFQIDKEEAKTVQKIFEMYAGGSTMFQIIDYLNSQHLKTSRGANFNKNSLQSILSNRRYIGIYTYKNTEIKDGMPRIVSDEIFYKVQEMLEKNKKAPARAKATEEYLLTTKLFCGHCRSMMTGYSGTSRTGTAHHYYVCNNRKKGCDKKNVRKRETEDMVIAKALEQLTDDNIAKIAVEVEALCEREQGSINLKRLTKQLEETENAIENLLKALKQGQAVDIITERITKKQQEKTELEKSIAVEQVQYVRLTASEIKFFLTKLKNGDINDMSYRKMIITVMVNSVYLYDDGRMMIIFNAGNKPVTVDVELLDELEHADGSYLKDSALPKNGISTSLR